MSFPGFRIGIIIACDQDQGKRPLTQTLLNIYRRHSLLLRGSCFKIWYWIWSGPTAVSWELLRDSNSLSEVRWLWNNDNLLMPLITSFPKWRLFQKRGKIHSGYYHLVNFNQWILRTNDDPVFLWDVSELVKIHRYLKVLISRSKGSISNKHGTNYQWEKEIQSTNKGLFNFPKGAKDFELLFVYFNLIASPHRKCVC